MSNEYYFFGTRTTFIQAEPKIFCRVNGALVCRDDDKFWSEAIRICLEVREFPQSV